LHYSFILRSNRRYGPRSPSAGHLAR